MASEIRAATQTGKTLYCHIVNASGKFWNGSSFETYSSGNWSTYTVSLAEKGSSGVYFADFPSAITAASQYEYFTYLQSGGSPAESDRVVGTGTTNWNGAANADVISGAMSGADFLTYVKRVFKRTDKDTELYDAITDAVMELRRIYSFDEAQIETTTTGQITVLGQFKIAVEDDLGLIDGDIIVIDGDDSQPVQKISKGLYDTLYPNPSSTTVTKDKPQHFAVWAGYIYFGPVPDSVSYTYRINYSKTGVTVTAASVSVPFTKYYREPLRYGVLAKAFDGLDQALASEYMQKWEYFKQQMMTREERNQRGTGFIEYHGV